MLIAISVAGTNHRGARRSRAYCHYYPCSFTRPRVIINVYNSSHVCYAAILSFTSAMSVDARAFTTTLAKYPVLFRRAIDSSTCILVYHSDRPPAHAMRARLSLDTSWRSYSRLSSSYNLNRGDLHLDVSISLGGVDLDFEASRVAHHGGAVRLVQLLYIRLVLVATIVYTVRFLVSWTLALRLVGALDHDALLCGRRALPP